MKTAPRFLALALALAWLGNSGPARAQAPVYTSNTDANAVPQPGAVHFLQVINLGQGPGTYLISTITFSAYFTTTDTQSLILFFYTGVDPSPTATNALANATRLVSTRGDLPPGAVVPRGYVFTFIPAAPILITTGSGSIGIEFFLVTQDGSDYSSSAYGRFTPNTPTVGSADGFVWNDGTGGDFDGVFTGPEQTRFGMPNANVRLALTGSLLRTNSFSRSGGTANLTIDSYAGINYQLQRATSLTLGDWANVGSAAGGANGTTLTFTDDDSTDPQAFYRVTVAPAPTPTPSAAGGRANSAKPVFGRVPTGTLRLQGVARPD